MSHTILLVDDSPTHRSLMKVFLSGHGLEFLEADNGLRALEMLETSLPDLVIADVNMPEMDGVTFVRRLRANGDMRLRRMPVILLTGNKSAQLSSTGIAAGADAWLHKPVSSAGILEAVAKVLGMPLEDS